MIRLLLKTFKSDGLSMTLKKVFGFSVKKFHIGLNRFPVYIHFFRLKVSAAILPRFKKRIFTVLSLQIFFCDLKSLYMEYKDIFKNQIYHFTPLSGSEKPLIIDGGGFIGISTLYFATVYPRARILVFEPDRTALQFLKRNIELNNFESRVTLIEKGLSRKDGEVSFEASNTDAGKISELGDHSISVTRLSNFITEKVDFVKLNIEGAELDVLRDIDEQKKFPLIDQLCIEWHSFSQSSQNLDEVLMLLKKNGYKYIINHFDYITNKAVRPPFEVKKKTQFYLLIFAKRIDVMNE